MGWKECGKDPYIWLLLIMHSLILWDDIIGHITLNLGGCCSGGGSGATLGIFCPSLVHNCGIAFC